MDAELYPQLNAAPCSSNSPVKHRALHRSLSPEPSARPSNTPLPLVPIGANSTAQAVLGGSPGGSPTPAVRGARSQSPLPRDAEALRHPPLASFPPLLLVKNEFLPFSPSQLYLPVHSVVKTISSDGSGWGYGILLEGLGSPSSINTGWFPHSHCKALEPIPARIIGEVASSFGEADAGIGVSFAISPTRRVYVHDLKSGGVAAQSGMLDAGDEVLNINGREASLCTAHELCSLVLGPPGTRVHLTLRAVGAHAVRGVHLTRQLPSPEPATRGRGGAQREARHQPLVQVPGGGGGGGGGGYVSLSGARETAAYSARPEAKRATELLKRLGVPEKSSPHSAAAAAPAGGWQVRGLGPSSEGVVGAAPWKSSQEAFDFAVDSVLRCVVAGVDVCWQRANAAQLRGACRAGAGFADEERRGRFAEAKEAIEWARANGRGVESKGEDVSGELEAMLREALQRQEQSEGRAGHLHRAALRWRMRTARAAALTETVMDAAETQLSEAERTLGLTKSQLTATTGAAPLNTSLSDTQHSSPDAASEDGSFSRLLSTDLGAVAEGDWCRVIFDHDPADPGTGAGPSAYSRNLKPQPSSAGASLSVGGRGGAVGSLRRDASPVSAMPQPPYPPPPASDPSDMAAAIAGKQAGEGAVAASTLQGLGSEPEGGAGAWKLGHVVVPYKASGPGQLDLRVGDIMSIEEESGAWTRGRRVQAYGMQGEHGGAGCVSGWFPAHCLQPRDSYTLLSDAPRAATSPASAPAPRRGTRSQGALVGSSVAGAGGGAVEEALRLDSVLLDHSAAISPPSANAIRAVHDLPPDLSPPSPTATPADAPSSGVRDAFPGGVAQSPASESALRPQALYAAAPALNDDRDSDPRVAPLARPAARVQVPVPVSSAGANDENVPPMRDANNEGPAPPPRQGCSLKPAPGSRGQTPTAGGGLREPNWERVPTTSPPPNRAASGHIDTDAVAKQAQWAREQLKLASTTERTVDKDLNADAVAEQAAWARRRLTERDAEEVSGKKPAQPGAFNAARVSEQAAWARQLLSKPAAAEGGTAWRASQPGSFNAARVSEQAQWAKAQLHITALPDGGLTSLAEAEAAALPRRPSREVGGPGVGPGSERGAVEAGGKGGAEGGDEGAAAELSRGKSDGPAGGALLGDAGRGRGGEGRDGVLGGGGEGAAAGATPAGSSGGSLASRGASSGSEVSQGEGGEEKRRRAALKRQAFVDSLRSAAAAGDEAGEGAAQATPRVDGEGGPRPHGEGTGTEQGLLLVDGPEDAPSWEDARGAPATASVAAAESQGGSLPAPLPDSPATQRPRLPPAPLPGAGASEAAAAPPWNPTAGAGRASTRGRGRGQAQEGAGEWITASVLKTVHPQNNASRFTMAAPGSFSGLDLMPPTPGKAVGTQGEELAENEVEMLITELLHKRASEELGYGAGGLRQSVAPEFGAPERVGGAQQDFGGARAGLSPVLQGEVLSGQGMGSTLGGGKSDPPEVGWWRNVQDPDLYPRV